MDKTSNDWEQEPEWRGLAMVDTQLYIERVVGASGASRGGGGVRYYVYLLY